MKKVRYIVPLLLGFLLMGVHTAFASPLAPESAITVGLADEGGHGDEADTHADDEDDHSEDEDGHAEDEETHGTDDGHSNDDGHHDGPFTWASLIPLFAGIGFAAVVSGTSVSMSSTKLGGLNLGIIALTTVTGALHLLIGLGGYTLLLLNGLGYLGLLGLLYLPIPALTSAKSALRIVLILYTAATFVGYFALHSVAQFDALGILSKVVEAVLIALLVVQVMRPAAK